MIGGIVAILRWLGRGLIALVLLLLGRRRRRRERSSRDLPATPSREGLVRGLILASAASSIGFIAVYAISADTQLLGIAIGAALGLLSAAAIVAGNALVPQEEASEERARFAIPGEGEPEEDEEEAEATARVATRAGAKITRRRLLIGAGGAAGIALGAAAATPLASLGPGVGREVFPSPWKDGVRLVDENGLAVPPDVLDTGGFLTAFAEGSDPRQFGSPVVVVRVDPARLELPADRSDWAPEGLLAFSKICTHAGCAVNLFRNPSYPPKEPGPALVCPCHYSTFDVLKGGERIFGPAGRALPQLPLRIDTSGTLVAAGPMSGQVGPAWSGVRKT